jgi:hypothetical protein
MSTVSAFNDMMEQFLSELALTFPEEAAMKKYQAKFELARVASPRLTLDVFMKGIAPFTAMIMSKDEQFFKNHLAEIPILEEMNMHECWNDDVSSATKDAIWQYIQTLYILGTTISMFPPETLSMIETAAAKCAEDMNAGPGNNRLDEAALTGLISQMMGGMSLK